MDNPWKIVFMGTPEFSVPTLQALHESEHDIVLVVTQPDRPKGRGRKLVPTPVKAAARDLGYGVIQPKSIKTEDFLQQMRTLAPDLFIVVAFGHLLPSSLLEVPRMGAINIHGSLLPQHRGPAPIQWAIINGDKTTGVTTMQLDKGMDTGDILLQESVDISGDDTAATLFPRLASVGAGLLLKTLDRLKKGDLQPTPQDESKASHAPFLKKQDGRIDWRTPATRLESFIRGMTPWPGAFTFLEDKRLKIFKARPADATSPAPAGTVIEGFPDELRVSTGDGVLCILELQGASGKRLTVDAFLRGHPIPEGTVLS